MTGFWLAVASAAMLVLSFGILGPATAMSSAAGAIAAEVGRRRIARGEVAPRRLRLAKAGVATTVLSLAALVLWVVLFVFHRGGGD